MAVDEPSEEGCVDSWKDVDRSSYGRRASCLRPGFVQKESEWVRRKELTVTYLRR